MMRASQAAKTQKGFTLMELLVVLGIFSMVVTAASDIFMLTSRSQRKVFGLERTQSDARFTMEAIAREIRTGRLDYAYYAARPSPGIALPERELALTDSTGLPERFFTTSDAQVCADAESAPCLAVSVNGAPASAITPKGVAVQGAAFYISPTADPAEFVPATGAYASSEQPRVTIVLTLASTSGKAEDRTTLRLQTTVMNRRYPR